MKSTSNKKTILSLNSIRKKTSVLNLVVLLMCFAVITTSFIEFTIAPASAAVTTSFGQTVKGSSAAWQPTGVMVGSRFTSSDSGLANSISIYVNNPSAASINIKCAVYSESDKKLVAVTEEKAVIRGFDGWQTFNFPTQPSLSAGVSYSLVAWFSASNLRIYYSSGGASQSWYASQAYGSFPAGPYSGFTRYGQENLVYSMYATLTTTTVPSSTPAPTSINVGQTSAGNAASMQPAGILVASRFTASNNGNANSITAYLSNTGSATGRVKCAIYRESDKTLLASTQEKSISGGSIGWQTFTFTTAPTLTAGASYSIVAWFATSNLQISYGSGTTQQSWYAGQTYGNFPTGSYTSLSSYNQENVVYSLYTTVTTTTSSPIQSPTPTTAPTPTASQTPRPTATPTPRPTTTPAPTTNNLVPLPSAWYLDRTGQYLDTSVTYNGLTSIRLDKPAAGSNNPDREVNSKTIAVHPGDRIVFSAWMKTTASGLGDTNPYSGARIGIDFYNGQRILGWQSASWPENSQSVQQNYVPWGTSTWTKRTMEMIVPQTITADGGFGYPAGTQVTPTSVILWLQVWSSTYGASDSGQAWFADPQFYINP